MGTEHQKSLCLALESAPAIDPDVAWTILRTILCEGSREGALAATQTAAALLNLAGSVPGERLRVLLDALEERYQRTKNRDERTEILVQLLQRSLPILETTLDPTGLLLLGERYLSFTEKIRCAVVRLFHAAPLAAERKVRFIETMLSFTPDSHVHRELVNLLAMKLASEGSFQTGSVEKRLEVLRAPVPPAWEGFYASAVAQLGPEDHAFVAEVVRDVLSPQPVSPYRGIVVLRETIRSGRIRPLCDALVSIPPEQVPRARGAVLGEIVREVANSPGERQTRTQVHRISHIPVRPSHHQTARWVEGRRSSAADHGEAEDAPHGERSSNNGYQTAKQLWQPELGRPGHARPGKRLRRQVDEHDANEERGVRQGPDQDAHHRPGIGGSPEAS